MTRHVKQSSRALHCQLGDVFVLMDAETGDYFELNTVGSRLWAEIASPVATGDLVNRLLGDFEVDLPTCEAAVQAWIDKMQALGFVVIGEGEPQPGNG